MRDESRPAAIPGWDQTGIACFTRFLWRDRFETSRHHLMRALSRRCDVVYVEPAPNLGRIAQGVVRDRERLRLELARPLDEGRVRVCRPLVPQLPLEMLVGSPRLYDRACRSQGRRLGRLGRRELGTPARTIAFNSFYPARAAGIVAGLRPDLDVYHCTDDVAELSQRLTVAHGSALERAQRAAVAAADLVLASAPALVEKLAQINPRTFWLPNGVDLATFAPALETGPDPPDLPPAPRLLIVGNLEHGRQDVADLDLLAEIARAEPTWSLVVVGEAPPAGNARPRLADLPNVYLLGLRPRSQLAAYMRAADACLIPYVTSTLTRSISPLKLNEYLAAGRPVVATPFSSALDGYEDCVVIAPPREYLAALRALLSDGQRDAPAAVARRVAKARTNSWNARADRLAELIEELW